MAIDPVQLQAIESGFGIQLPASSELTPGRMVQFHLLAPADLTVTDLVPAPFSLTWITKSIRWKDDQPIAAIDPALTNLPAAIDAGLPTLVPTVSTPTTPLGTQQLSGVPGEFSQLAGSYSLPITVPVEVRVCWSVKKADGSPAGAGDCCAGGPIDSKEFSVAFLPPIVELTVGVALPVEQYTVEAMVTLAAGGQEHTFTLPVTVLVPDVGIPTVAALFRHHYFQAVNNDGDRDGIVLLMVPGGSPFSTVEQLQSGLGTLHSTLADLASVATGSYGPTLALLDVFRSAIADQPTARLETGSGFLLNHIKLIERTWPSSDIFAEDRMSSLILLGPPARKLECYVRRSYQSGEGIFDLIVGRRRGNAGDTYGPEVIAVVRTLHASQLSSEPTGAEVDIREPADTFGDELSSVSFSSANPKPQQVIGPKANQSLKPCQPALMATGRLLATRMLKDEYARKEREARVAHGAKDAAAEHE